jgi:hypothetical protein
MAVTLTQNLKLRVSSDLTSDSKYNLAQIDTLGSIYQTDTTALAKVRSKTDILLQTNDPDIGGSGSGGVIDFGNANQLIGNINLYSENGIGLFDTATSGSKLLNIVYKSDISGSVDTTANRTLSIDLEGNDRSLTLGGNLTTDNTITLNTSGITSVTLPTTGTLATLAGAETLTNKIIDSDNNTITNIVNADIKSSAAIDGTKIDPLFGSQEVNSSLGFSSTVGIPFILPLADGTANQVMATDGSGNLSFVTATSSALSNLTDVSLTAPALNEVLTYNGSVWVNQAVSGGASVDILVETWENADGVTKTINHSLNSTNLMIQILDVNNKNINISNIERTSTAQVVLEASSAPATVWTVLILKLS